ncbi:unnamed protein product [Didymodactylos carnosus]|uniref:Uncharacterized protein n=1 Tax=Didymodactylos carnosus TaxID=1234261 RepID=A0A813SMU8_9BILA|nr:unnamed protein product [Didymodactylos carnosus]CAF0852139.1 unnamed protein product [Didymodactylos carnosus]CAF3582782.1 unnamed protein product [Didymodactylos carnosus]CAF3637339.1 unnamed protein product [Didymodactylos carnosus]
MNDNGSATINGDDDNDSITTSLFNTRKFPSMFNRTTSSNPFEMFEMLTKAVFEKFFNDDFFWNHFASGPSHMDSGFHFPNLNETRQNPSRLRTSSQRRPLSPAAHRTKIHVGTNLNNNGSKPNDTHFEWLENSKKRRQTPPQSSFTRFDSDEENEDNKNTQEYRFKKQQTQPSSFPTRLRRRTMADHRIESCQYCFRPLASSENLLQHEAHCKLNRKYPSSMYTMRNANNNSKTSKNDENIFTSSSHVKCNYCHEYICLSDKFDHETLCRRFGPKNSSTYTTTAKDRKYNTTTSPSPSTKSSTLNGNNNYK